MFTGREYDSETGLYFYRSRYYDPAIGRFISEDPIGFSGGDVNLYAYVRNNPVKYRDPKGLWGIGLLGSGSAEIGLVAAGTGVTGSIGGGIFGNGTKDIDLRGFSSIGAFAGGPKYGPCYSGNKGGIVGGAFAGVGGGLFITNAVKVNQLSGVSDTYTFNVGVGPLKVSVQLGVSNETWIGSITLGPGIGISGSGYQTSTWTTK